MYAPSNLGVGSKAFAITPNNVTNNFYRARTVYVGGGGNVSLVTPDGNAVLFTNVPAGFLLPVECIRVNSAGTTATFMVGIV